jgi:uncharacterized repeat protein (TIGR01451 family)
MSKQSPSTSSRIGQRPRDTTTFRSSTWRRRARRRLLFVVPTLLATIGAGLLQPAVSSEIAVGNWTPPVTNASGASTTLDLPSGLTVDVRTSGLTTLLPTETLGRYGFVGTHFTPAAMATTDSAAHLRVNKSSACPGAGICTGLGQVTISFEQPVRDPVLHLAGLGGSSVRFSNGQVVAQSDWHAVWNLVTPGLSLSLVDGNGQMVVPGGSRITGVVDSTSNFCDTNATNGAPAAATGLCGSVRVNGVVTSVSFDISAVFVANPGFPPNQSSAGGDQHVLTVTAPQDLSDAPASYDGTQAPAHLLSDLALGATVDEDSVDIRNPTQSPFASPTADGDGADDDAVAPLPDIPVEAGTEYSLTLPLSGVNRPARLCGWVDLDRSGTFSAAERSCAAPSAGATSADLAWTVPAGATPGLTYARFRLGYNAAQVESPTGLSDSGEVEDHALQMADSAVVVLQGITLGGAGGPFDFELTNTEQPVGSVTTTAEAIPVQADGDVSSAGTQPFTVDAPGVPVTISQSSIPNGWVLTDATCTDEADVSVGSFDGTTLEVRADATRAGSVVNCSFVNALPAIALVKRAEVIADADGNGPDAGDPLDYSFDVTNTGPVALTNVGVQDAATGPVTCPATTLEPDAEITCTAVRLLTQADVDAGTVANTATASGTARDEVTVTAVDSVTTTVASQAAIELEKTVVDPSPREVGDLVTYRFIVTNTGTATLSDVEVSDPMVGLVSCASTTLAPTQSTTCSGPTYQVTEVDGLVGSVTNTATTRAQSCPTTGAPCATADDTDSVAMAVIESPAPPALPPGGGPVPGDPSPSPLTSDGSVPDSRAPLARTGGSFPVGLLGLAAGLVVAGAVLTVAARHRRSDATDRP